MTLADHHAIKATCAQLYWSDAPGCFDESASVRSWAYLGAVPRTLKFAVPPCATLPTEFKLVLDPVPAAVKLYDLQVLDRVGKIVYRWENLKEQIATITPQHDALKETCWSVHLSAQMLQMFPLNVQAKQLKNGCTFELRLSCYTSVSNAQVTSGGRIQELESLPAVIQLRQELACTRAALEAVYVSKSWRWTLPLRNALIASKALSDKFKKARTVSSFDSSNGKPPALPNIGTVDVIVPVYRGIEETRRCLESIISAGNKTPHELIVINDFSPEPEVTAYLGEIAEEGKVRLIEHETNQGYTSTVNEGISLHPERDVVLLNSDTIVTNDWLDRLVSAGYSRAKVGTVTPFSNNATLCSYPQPFSQNDLPEGWSSSDIDLLMRRRNSGRYANIPTAVGFCMYIRRECMEAVGIFDAENFPGYGEENDFSIRATSAGWSHLLAGDTFVHHKGEVSFAHESKSRQAQALANIRRVHPEYFKLIAQHTANDSAAPLRHTIDIERLRLSNKPKVLMLLPDITGGTERYIEDVVKSVGENCECLGLKIFEDNFVLRWLNTSEAFTIKLSRKGEYDTLLELLRSMPIQRVHVQHVIKCNAFVKSLIADLHVPFDFTAHDFFTVCPRVTLADSNNQYCGQPDEDSCNRCIAVNGVTCASSIQQWRQDLDWLYDESERVFVPSDDAAARLLKCRPDANLIVTSHPDAQRFGKYPEPVARILRDDEPLRVAVLGALDQVKGADMLENAAIASVGMELSLEFHHIGYAYRHLQKRPQANLVAYGKYKESDLRSILRQVRPHLIWFPASIPETYSYTLSACLELGLPVVAPDLGAFAERLSGRPWSWIVPWNKSAEQWNQFFAEIAEAYFKSGVFSSGASSAALPGCDVTSSRAEFHYDSDYIVPIKLSSLVQS